MDDGRWTTDVWYSVSPPQGVPYGSPSSLVQLPFGCAFVPMLLCPFTTLSRVDSVLQEIQRSQAQGPKDGRGNAESCRIKRFSSSDFRFSILIRQSSIANRQFC